MNSMITASCFFVGFLFCLVWFGPKFISCLAEVNSLLLSYKRPHENHIAYLFKNIVYYICI